MNDKYLELISWMMRAQRAIQTANQGSLGFDQRYNYDPCFIYDFFIVKGGLLSEPLSFVNNRPKERYVPSRSHSSASREHDAEFFHSVATTNAFEAILQVAAKMAGARAKMQ